MVLCKLLLTSSRKAYLWDYSAWIKDRETWPRYYKKINALSTEHEISIDHKTSCYVVFIMLINVKIQFWRFNTYKHNLGARSRGYKTFFMLNNWAWNFNWS